MMIGLLVFCPVNAEVYNMPENMLCENQRDAYHIRGYGVPVLQDQDSGGERPCRRHLDVA